MAKKGVPTTPEKPLKSSGKPTLTEKYKPIDRAKRDKLGVAPYTVRKMGTSAKDKSTYKPSGGKGSRPAGGRTLK